MENIITYLEKYNDISFEEHPFTPVDALVLSQFVYLKWEHVIPLMADGEDSITLVEMSERMQDAEVFFYDYYEMENRRLFELMLKGRRFGKMKCNYLSNRLDDSVETQFLAFTVFLEDVVPIVLYRGTDETLLGWKEDYNMTSNDPVTGQRMALLYLERVALRLGDHMMLAGHSKGGNLAVYAAITANKKLQSRIDCVYNFDGPHFRKEILEKNDISCLNDKIKKYIPKSSVVGILLETKHNYRVVDSPAHLGGAQHSPYKWDVNEDDFVYLDKVDKSSLNLNEKIKNALYKLSDEQIKIIGDALFEILYGSELDTLQDMSKEKFRSAKRMIQAMKDIDGETKDEVKAILKIILKS